MPGQEKAQTGSSGSRSRSSKLDFGLLLQALHPLWDARGDAPMGEGMAALPDLEQGAQPAPGYEVDQRIHW